MIHKYWNVKLSSVQSAAMNSYILHEESVTDEARAAFLARMEAVESQYLKIWKTLAEFEETTATMISDTLLHFSNGNFLLAMTSLAHFIETLDAYEDCISTVDVVKVTRGLESMFP
jgi:hypothetical protein